MLIENAFKTSMLNSLPVRTRVDKPCVRVSLQGFFLPFSIRPTQVFRTRKWWVSMDNAETIAVTIVNLTTPGMSHRVNSTAKPTHKGRWKR